MTTAKTPVMAGLTEGVRAEATIDLAALRGNLDALRERIGGATVMAAVKADAYGHGALRCAREAVAAGVGWLGTATPEEALALRAGGVGPEQARILCWLWTPGGPWREALFADLDISISGDWALTELLAAVRATGIPARVHLKADTGLGRNGCQPHDWPELVAAARRAELDGLLTVVGVWSHFAAADEPGHPSIQLQLDAFRLALASAEAAGLRPEVRHLANSPAALLLPQSHFDMVRTGLAMYGLSPVPEVGSPSDFGLRPVMSLTARLALVKHVPGGHGVSYGHHYTTPGPTTLGLVPVGYGDGIPRHASGIGPVQVDGKWRTVAGRVAMDQFVVDLGGDTPPIGDEVLVFGSGDRGEPTAEDWGRACGTISYEIVTRIGSRVPRRYVGGLDEGLLG
ncbi:alanine racemase [Kitasatospora purpeofusca]|uniref:alanine racemase n=1 Tax=Kitasatospora purpeofusca TaxID=67352 RepID=UPI0022541105|nr:alanine racemase [Kitasatospora purpeofusca]MCX4753279.1 alanine racemase [Kitasatospora purpeofusca]WSR32793.1 alanine racemase [Kitasatospora purpeofusca]WSR40884.1 alanine racemase [Kitasatospora purpeofusca]